MQVMTIRKSTQLLPLLLIFLFIIVSCAPQEPVIIYVTPTTDATSSSVSTIPSPTSVDSSGVAETTALPTFTPLTQLSPQPGSTIIGPVIGPNYTLEPTETPRATNTPPPSPTPVISDTPAAPTSTPPPPGTPVPGLDGSQIGIQIHTDLGVPEWADTLSRVRHLGVGWVKVQANWEWLQPNGPNEFGQNFGLFQLHVEAAHNAGFNVMISIAKAPPWARSNQNEDGPPDDIGQWVNFINFLLEKVGDEIAAIEIWNEPNLIREWTGNYPMTGAGYMQIFRPAYDAIRAFSPNIIIVTAGLAPTGDLGFAVNDRTFLQQMYDAGLGNYRDIAIGVHPYSWGNAPDAVCCAPGPERGWDDQPQFFFADTIQDYRDIMVNNGHGDIQLWVTEFGWATWEGFPTPRPPGQDWMDYNSVWDQANYTIRALEIGQELGYIGPMFLWNLNFAQPFTIDQSQEVAAYSMIVPYNPPERPLYNMLYDAIGRGAALRGN